MQTMQVSRGMRFLHARVLDPSKMPEKVPQLYEVTKVTQHSIYYAAVYDYGEGRLALGSQREYCEPALFHKICSQIVQ